jgi:hypothetical protein
MCRHANLLLYLVFIILLSATLSCCRCYLELLVTRDIRLFHINLHFSKPILSTFQLISNLIKILPIHFLPLHRS